MPTHRLILPDQCRVLQIDLGAGLPQRIDRPIPLVVRLQALIDHAVVHGPQAVDDVFVIDRKGDVIELDDEQNGRGVQDEVQVLGGCRQKEEIDDHHKPSYNLHTNAVWKGEAHDQGGPKKRTE